MRISPCEFDSTILSTYLFLYNKALNTQAITSTDAQLKTNTQTQQLAHLSGQGKGLFWTADVSLTNILCQVELLFRTEIHEGNLGNTKF